MNRDVAKIEQKAQKTSNDICKYTNLGDNKLHKEFSHIVDEIKEVCGLWCGSTYVGQRKSKNIENAFQCFFNQFMIFLIFCKSSRYLFKRNFAKQVLYQGKIHRYLGYGDLQAVKPFAIKPEYNEIYVSWSKEPQNSYIEGKLYGKITWIEAEIKSSYFGIDLESMGISRGKEREVVFPTVKECVREIKVIGEYK